MSAGRLAGKRVLIVEDDFILSRYLQFILTQAGATPVGPVHIGAEAVAMVGAEALNGALLDFGLRDSTTEEVAESLEARGVPYVFVSAFPRDVIPGRLRGRPFLSKPFQAGALVDVAVRTFGDGSAQPLETRQ
jgi:DNA-binding response OmpR family regulator